jgi:RHS repeat-associated protein
VNNGAVRVVYDGDGNRVAKTVGGVTTRYLVDDLSPTRYSQVVEEVVDGAVERTYTYGEGLISQRLRRNGGWQRSFYGHDAHGSVRFLTDANGAVTDTYAYDAFGVLTSVTGTTPNHYLFNGQQYDADLGVYFKRARYYSQDRGRFLTVDPLAGRPDDSLSLHRYLFGHADPVNRIDPWGTAAEYAFISRTMQNAYRAALICIRNATITMMKEAATELVVAELTLYVAREIGGARYAGRTGRTKSMRFTEHLRTSRFANGMEAIGHFTVEVPDFGDTPEGRSKTKRLIRAIEQIVIDKFGGTTQLSNRRNEIDLKKNPNYREVFCKGK